MIEVIAPVTQEHIDKDNGEWRKTHTRSCDCAAALAIKDVLPSTYSVGAYGASVHDPSGYHNEVTILNPDAVAEFMSVNDSRYKYEDNGMFVLKEDAEVPQPFGIRLSVPEPLLISELQRRLSPPDAANEPGATPETTPAI